MSLNKTRKRAIAIAKQREFLRLSPMERTAYRVGEAMLSLGRVVQTVAEEISKYSDLLIKNLRN